MKTLRLLLTAYMAVYAVTGCASSAPVGPPGRTLPPGEELFYPRSEPKIQFLLSLASQGDLRGRGDAGPWLGKPFGVAFQDSVLRVCDTMLRGVQILDFRTRGWNQVRPSGAARLQTPVSCRMDAERGHLYVTDPGRQQVVVLDTAYAVLHRIEFPDGRPTDAFVLGDTVWVSDAIAREVHVFEQGEVERVRVLTDTTALESPDDRLFQPTKLWVTEDEVYVTDIGDFRVKVYDRAGRFLRSVGRYGPGMGEFVRPKGLAVDAERRLYVVDAGFSNVQVFDPAGELLGFFGGPTGALGGLDLPADIYLTSKDEDLAFFQQYVAPGFDLEHVIFVSSQYGKGLINIYGFVTSLDDAGPRDR